MTRRQKGPTSRDTIASEHLPVILLWSARVKVSLRGTDEMIGVLALVFAIPLGSAFLWLEAIK